jgi:hypothetical protein
MPTRVNPSWVERERTSAVAAVQSNPISETVGVSGCFRKFQI